ncbi:MAG: hypothetical protein EBX36_12970, partial [Planctomycetia bacterium]|nr:hypothetical protein [Planctomycetia bacterium]
RLFRIPQEHADAIVDAADFVGGNGVHLARVMWAESRMKPTAVNPTSGATGLIQFMPTTAGKLGTTTEALRGMTFLQQMRYVGDYLIKVAGGEWVPGVQGLLDTQFKMAASVFYPAWTYRDPSTVLPENVRAANPGINTMGQYVDFVLRAKPPGETVASARLPGAPGASGYARAVGARSRARAGGVASGSLTGPGNPCNLWIEADRVDRRLAQPDREMLATYLDVPKPAVIAACADELAKRAKALGVPTAKANAALRAGVQSWYNRSLPGAGAQIPRGGGALSKAPPSASRYR